MLVLGLDLETTGLNTAEDRIIEIGALLWDTERNIPMNPSLSAFLTHDKPLEEVIVKLTGITDADLKDHGHDPKMCILALTEKMMAKADAIVAHNGNLFDKPMLLSNAARLGVKVPDKLWIDTSTDIEFPPTITTRRLVHLAAEHGFVNPFAHRALFDVATMLQVAGKYDWEQILKYAKSPTLVVEADVGYHGRELAKKRNYRFNGETKKWTKGVKDFQLEDERKSARELGFNVIVYQ